MYILIDLGCDRPREGGATQVPGAAAFFYSYIAVLVVILGVGNRVGAVVFRLAQREAWSPS